MIDTIIMRLHGLDNYKATVNILNKRKTGASTQFYVDEATGKGIEYKSVHAVFYDGSNHIDLVNHRNSIKLPSSHYELAYKIDFKADFIEFNFSIPKYRWGTNLFQFIDYFSQSAEKQFNILMEFIRRWKANLLDTISDYDLEIVRLDFCYNQFFVSKEEALKYKNIQEKAFEKKARGAGSFQKYGDETLMLKTDRYSFKVYHKGPEFYKGDYKRLAKNNIKGYDLQKLLDISNRILRYECTFRSSYLFYAWQQLYVNSSRHVKRNVYTYLFRTLRIQEAARSQKKISDNIVAKRFFVKSRFDNWSQYLSRDGIDAPKNFFNDHKVSFTFELFHVLFKEFWKHVNSVQIKTSSNVSVHLLRKRIDSYNREENTKIALSTCKQPKFKNVNHLLFYFEISQRTSLKSYMRKGMISARTYQRIIKVFKRLGLADYNPVVNLATPSLGYQDYKSYFQKYVYT
jgi:hypothetical protein